MLNFSISLRKNITIFVSVLLIAGLLVAPVPVASAPTLTLSATAAITDGATFTTLDGALGIATVVIGGSTYALVAGYDDNGVQIIDITTPSSPTAVAAITDGATFTELAGAWSIKTVVIGAITYAVVASYNDDGVQIIKILSSVTTTTVTAGVSTTKTLPAGGTMEVTLPSASKVSFTLPSGISGDVTVVTSNSGSSAASITFLGTVVEFTTAASCATGCPVAFNFTQAQLTASGFSSSQIKVFHDSSGDGSFATSEALTTTISTFSGGFTATASTPSTSKFAI